MPGYKMHIVGGGVTYAAALYFLSYWMNPSIAVAAEWLFCALIGSLFPDIDIKSKGQKLFYRFFAVLLIALALQGRLEVAAVLGIVVLLPMLVRHRGLFHEPWFLMALPLALAACATAWYPALQISFLCDAFFFYCRSIFASILRSRSAGSFSFIIDCLSR